MIPYNELRAGIWVQPIPLKRDVIVHHPVRQFVLKDIYLIDNEEYQFNPVLLTESWFQQFGFVKEPAAEWENMWRKDTVFICYNEIGYYKTADNIFDSYPFNYVHQLQTLFYALTGIELTIEN